MEHFLRLVESAVTTISKYRDVTLSCLPVGLPYEMGRIYPFYFYFSLVRKMETCRSPAKYCFVPRVSCAYLCYVSGGILVEMRRYYQVDTEQTMAMKPMCLIGSLSKIYPFGAQ